MVKIAVSTLLGSPPEYLSSMVPLATKEQVWAVPRLGGLISPPGTGERRSPPVLATTSLTLPPNLFVRVVLVSVIT